jgi:hypothetical protein
VPLTTKCFDVAQFTVLTSLILLFCYRQLFRVVGSKIFSTPIWHKNIPTEFSYATYENDGNHSPIPHKDRLAIITYLLTWCMHIQINDITPATSQNDKWHPITNTLHNIYVPLHCTL